ncbi:MAG: HK97 family phage prohead protease [Nitrospira sp.]|nr:HK97 family phage prohead protease [Nitrospira sp.]
MVATLEHRVAVEWRTAGRKLIGLAAPFNSPATLGDVVETIRPGAFKKSLASGADVVALIDHDTSRLLGRTKSGTLRLSESERGLLFEIDLPNTREAEDLLELAQRRDLGGMSFGFRTIADTWTGNNRELIEVDLKEISVVHSWPAYEATTVSARSKEQSDNKREQIMRQRFLETM